MGFEQAVKELYGISQVLPGPIGQTAKQFLATMQGNAMFDMQKLQTFANSDYETAAQTVLAGVKNKQCVNAVINGLADNSPKKNLSRLFHCAILVLVNGFQIFRRI